jgi:putative ABC transport system substrate-binding protein
MQTYAKELVAAQPDILVVRSTPATAALLNATRSIPVVFAVVSDPVGEGFVTSVARPADVKEMQSSPIRALPTQ